MKRIAGFGLLLAIVTASTARAAPPPVAWKLDRFRGSIHDLMVLGDLLFLQEQNIEDSAGELTHRVRVLGVSDGRTILDVPSGRDILNPVRHGDLLFFDEAGVKPSPREDAPIRSRTFDLVTGKEVSPERIPKAAAKAWAAHVPRAKRFRHDLPSRIAGLTFDGTTLYDYSWGGAFLWVTDTATGKTLWEKELGGLMDPDPVLSEGVLYAGNGSDLLTFDPKTGREMGAKHFEKGRIEREPAFADGLVIVTDSIGPREAFDYDRSYPQPRFHVFALEKKGWKERWSFEAEAMTGPVVSEGRVYFGSRDSFIHALDVKSGKELWRFKADGEIYETPVVSGGRLFFTTYQSVYALDLR